jgi:hypothetical protein
MQRTDWSRTDLLSVDIRNPGLDCEQTTELFNCLLGGHTIFSWTVVCLSLQSIVESFAEEEDHRVTRQDVFVSQMRSADAISIDVVYMRSVQFPKKYELHHLTGDRGRSVFTILAINGVLSVRWWRVNYCLLHGSGTRATKRRR